MADVIYSETPDVEWAHVAGLDDAKTAIQESIVLPLKFPDLFKNLRSNLRSNVLLFGPTGVGKTHLVEAASNATNSNLLRVCCKNLMNKDDPVKLVKDVFQLARESPTSAIIFLDNVESLSINPQRNDEEWNKRRDVMVELLILINDVTMIRRSPSVAIIAGTDAPWLISSPILRRFVKRRYCSLPDPDARRKIFEIGVGDSAPSDLSPQDYDILVEMTAGYPASTISFFVKCALAQLSKRLTMSTHFKRVHVFLEGQETDMKWAPCSSEDPEGVNILKEEIQWDNVVVPPLVLADFITVWEHVSTEIPQPDVERYERWN